MRRNKTSRSLFSSADDSPSSFDDVENPPDQPQIIRRQRSLPFSQPRVSKLMQAVIWYSVLLSLLCLFLCSLYYSLHSTLLRVALAVSVILFIAIFLFKTAPRTNLWLFGKKKQIFLDIKDMSATKKSIVNGLGVELLDDGTYSGEFKNGVRTGKGVLEIPGKRTFGGDWVEGVYDGYGVENLLDHGVYYMGQFSRGMRSGYGCMLYANGEQYQGEWLYGQRHGIGEQTCVDGAKYVGQFKQGQRHGFGADNYKFDSLFLSSLFLFVLFCLLYGWFYH